MQGMIFLGDTVVTFSVKHHPPMSLRPGEPMPGPEMVMVTTTDNLLGDTKHAEVPAELFMKALALAILYDGDVPATADEHDKFIDDAENGLQGLHRIMP